jgi:hypothetical protein
MASPAVDHPSWPTQTDDRFDVSIRVAPAWTVSWNPQRDGTLGDIVLIGSWSFSRLPECRPIPAGQALISLSEALPVDSVTASQYGPRPGRFETTHLRSLQVQKGCVQPRAKLFRFAESGRMLYVWMMFGRDLSTGVRTKAEATISTLSVEPQP